MNLAIVGYGKMGRMLERLAPDHGCTVKLILDEHNNRQGSGLTRENFAGIDAAIEFTTPETAVANIEGLLRIGVPVVVGTTGWLKELDRIRAMVTSKEGALVWSPNYSIGMNVFFRLVREAARLMADKDAYESWAWEIHHSAKKDAPSGTLLKLIEEMREAGYPKKVDTAASRAGFVPGTHEIGFDGPADTITLRHTVRNREGFAAGALHAAKWIAGRKGFFEFSEILFNERH